MGVKFYKKWIDREQKFQYAQRNRAGSDTSMTEITQEEYETEVSAQWVEYLASLPEEDNNDNPTYEELLETNAELESENAALLYQVLTGEEYSDV